jgi:magnesium-transporting ATPase (P-type)
MACCRTKSRAAAFQPSPGTGADVKWHALTLNDVMHHAAVSSHGLSQQEADSRLVTYGKNTMTPPAVKTFLRKLWEQLYNILIGVRVTTI